MMFSSFASSNLATSNHARRVSVSSGTRRVSTTSSPISEAEKDETRKYSQKQSNRKKSYASDIFDNQIIVINISGEIFQTFVSTLERFPDTLLGNKDRRENYRNEATGQYFFDRNSSPFEAILYFYQSDGLLSCPENMDLKMFIDELYFFDIGDETIENFQIDNGLKEPVIEHRFPSFGPFKRLWGILEYPETGLDAKVFATLSVLVIIASLVMFVIETVPGFELRDGLKTEFDEVLPSNKVSQNHAEWMPQTNTFIITWFTIEFLLRLLCCPNRFRFFLNTGNIIDFLSILPYYVGFLVSSSGDGGLVSILRVIRVLRALKLARYSRGLQILGNTLRSSFSDLVQIGFFLFVMVLIFGSCAYYAEHKIEGSEFSSIPLSSWWVVVTMTTVGYGDMVPQSVVGKLIGGLAAIGGVLTMSLPVPVVVAKFEYFYTKEKNRKKNEQSKKIGEQKKFLDQTWRSSSPSVASESNE